MANEGVFVEIADEADEDLCALVTEDLQDLYELTEKVGAHGAALDRLAVLRKKLRAALRQEQWAIFLDAGTAKLERAPERDEWAEAPASSLTFVEAPAITFAEAPAPAAE